MIAFIYVSIVEYSYINGNKSRLLRVIPLEGNTYESKMTSLVPINILQFNSILVELRGIDGEYISFEPHTKTIVNLRIAPLK